MAHGHVGYTLRWDEAEPARGEKVFSKQVICSRTYFACQNNLYSMYRKDHFTSSYYMLSCWPLTVPLSGKRASVLLMVLSWCFRSCSSLLCSKSVEADRGSPSLTRTTKANRIRDMILWAQQKRRKRTDPLYEHCNTWQNVPLSLAIKSHSLM